MATITNENWTTRFIGSAPIRHVAAANNGLLGTRPGPPVDNDAEFSAIQLWKSDDGGLSWKFVTDAAVSSTVVYRDTMIWSGTPAGHPGAVMLIAFGEYDENLGYSLRLIKSTDNGANWNFAGTIHDWAGSFSSGGFRFVGAPFLFMLSDGTLQVYYDTEVLPDQAGASHNQWIGMKTGAYNCVAQTWTWSTELTASRAATTTALARDGMATVVMLTRDPNNGGNDRIMVVTEGVEENGEGKPSNVVRAIQALNNGGRSQNNWDFSSQRRIVYKSAQIDDNDRRYNAYAPFAIRNSQDAGPVVVAFSTDEGNVDVNIPADLANGAVEHRHSQIKFVYTTSDFETWSKPNTLWKCSNVSTGEDHNYHIGLFRKANGHLLAVLDFFHGIKRVFY